MYLFSLESTTADSHPALETASPRRLNSTSAPLGWLSSLLSERRQRETTSVFGEMQVSHWQPIVCGGMVVYVRRAMN